ncbi:hypothetical protein FIBSPDRAFT_893063 [Athelia psychrophila]|uniref:Uncharacterized protein n=1 Tax=Athelia psychrophila TaxID=1759441 RepID=A0A166HNW6_9AGAM|nr:hypothetical protein FIBSPDRAFT_893063 [Fibularhizoctonia sp. CBS 109695]
MVNLKPLLFALLPVVTSPPTALRNLPAYTATDLSQTPAYITFVHTSKHKPKSCWKTWERGWPAIDGERITDSWLRQISMCKCRWCFRPLYRVTQDELLDMAEALKIPEYIVTPSQYVFDNIEALALTLAHFRTAGDQYEMSTTYCRSQSAISEIVNYIVTFIDSRWSHLLDFDHTNLLSPHNLETYAAAIHGAGAPLTGVWGFIDCTIRWIAHPSQWQ